MLRVVMTPSSVRLAKLRLCLWWGRIMDQGKCWDTALEHLLVVRLGNDRLGVWISTTTGAAGQVGIKSNGVFYDPSLPRVINNDSWVSLRSTWDECGRALVWGYVCTYVCMYV
jgi:hypothetical protein